MTSTIEQSVTLDVPVRTAYDQWTQFQEFPRFLTNVDEVAQLDDRHLRWREHFGGRTQEWELEICEQVPDKRIAWRSTSGPPTAGVVTFHRLSPERSRVMLQMEYTPEGIVQNVQEALGIADQQVREGLDAFKQFLETRGEATGAWRGTIPSPDDR